MWDDFGRAVRQLLPVARLTASAVRRAVASSLIALAASAAAPSPLAGQAGSVRVEVVPDSLSLGSDGVGTATLVVRNQTQGTVRQLRIRATADPELGVEITNAAVREIPASAAFATAVRVVGKAPVQTLRRVQLFTDFEQSAADAARGIPGVELTTLKVGPGPYERADQIAEIRLSSSLATLSDTDTGVVYLVIRNKADTELRVDSVLVASPSFLHAGSTAGVRIPRFSEGYVPIRVHAAERWVRSGKHLLIFDVPLAWTTAGGPRVGRAVHSREVDVKVLGESEILNAVAVPSFLLLPGALMVLAFGLLWRFAATWRGSAGGEKTEFPLAAPTPGFWVVAITLSGVMAFAYPRLGGRNYLHGYGVGDIARVWLLSVGIGATVYLLLAWWLRFRLWRRTGRITPRSSDQPLDVLRKLGLQGESLVRPVASFQQGGVVRQAPLLQPRDGGAGGRQIVGPVIAVEWDDEQATTDEKLKLDTLLASDDPTRIADFLEPRLSTRKVKVHWRRATANSVIVPTAVDAADISAGTTIRLVDVE